MQILPHFKQGTWAFMVFGIWKGPRPIPLGYQGIIILTDTDIITYVPILSIADDHIVILYILLIEKLE